MKIVNVGSLNIDRMYMVSYFAQPGETIKALQCETLCGGKGLNQSVALARAGAEVYHIGAIGNDGDILLNMLKEAQVKTEFVENVNGESGQAIIQVDRNGQNNIIVFGGANNKVSKDQIKRGLSTFSEKDLLLVQNEISNVDYAMKEAKARGMKIAFNPSPMTEQIEDYPLEMVDFFVVNEIEGRALSKLMDHTIEQVMDRLVELYPKASFVLTLGENGVYFFNRNDRLYHKSYRVQVVDTTGAGDTFCGYFLAGLMKKREYKEILQTASAAGAIAIGRKGAAQSIPKYKEVQEFLNGRREK